MFNRVRDLVRTIFGNQEEQSADIQLAEKTSMSRDKWLIVGLGNPGKKYKANRHNIGFMAVDRLAHQHGISASKKEKRAIVGSGIIDGNPVILAKPQTFMNNSGDSVGPIANYYNIPSERVIVIHDELDIDFGSIRLRKKGGSGGHNGMKSIIQHIGNEFPRIRLGIGRPPGKMPVVAYVLQDFKSNDDIEVDIMLDNAVKAATSIVTDGIDLAMNKYN